MHGCAADGLTPHIATLERSWLRYSNDYSSERICYGGYGVNQCKNAGRGGFGALGRHVPGAPTRSGCGKASIDGNASLVRRSFGIRCGPRLIRVTSPPTSTICGSTAGEGPARRPSPGAGTQRSCYAFRSEALPHADCREKVQRSTGHRGTAALDGHTLS